MGVSQIASANTDEVPYVRLSYKLCCFLFVFACTRELVAAPTNGNTIPELLRPSPTDYFDDISEKFRTNQVSPAIYFQDALQAHERTQKWLEYFGVELTEEFKQLQKTDADRYRRDLKSTFESLTTLPLGIRRLFKSHGLRIFVTAKKITETPILKSRESVVHYHSAQTPITTAMLPGLTTMDSAGRVVVAINWGIRTDSVDIVLHEVGHAYDKIIGLRYLGFNRKPASSGVVPNLSIQLPQFNTYMDDISWSRSYNKFYGTVRESFAETFARFFKTGTHRQQLETTAPSWSNYWTARYGSAK